MRTIRLERFKELHDRPGFVDHDSSAARERDLQRRAQTPCTVSVTGAGGLNLSPAPSYSNNSMRVPATASYTFAGDANHSGSSDSKNFTIDLASSTTVVSCPANVTYNGAAQTPCTVSVTGAGGLTFACSFLLEQHQCRNRDGQLHLCR
jgi:hypothetical protein